MCLRHATFEGFDESIEFVFTANYLAMFLVEEGGPIPFEHACRRSRAVRGDTHHRVGPD
jgi:hypothetical protein